jgi:WD40 repeat protein
MSSSVEPPTGGPTGGAASASAGAPALSSPTDKQQSEFAPTDQAVLDYLRKKGLGSAALELTNILNDQKKTGSQTKHSSPGEGETDDMLMDDGADDDDPNKSARERLEEEDLISRNQRSLLSKSTGGGYGYDRDAAWPIAQWGVPDTLREDLVKGARAGMGVQEARAYLDAFTSLQLWVLSLPDEDGAQYVENPLLPAKELLKSKDVTLESVIQQLAPSTRRRQAASEDKSDILYNVPPAVKPELLAVSFALLVHTYCELLEVGMESTAHTLRDAFRPVYEPLYLTEYRDLYQCATVDDIMRLNSHNSQHMEAISNLKSILVQVASIQLRREELNAHAAVAGTPLDKEQKDRKIREYTRGIEGLKQKYADLSQKASLAFDKMLDLPFLRRARAVRWQLTMSSQTYGMLAAFFRSQDDSLLAMSTLLQTKCELHVERRDPLPFTPACVFDDRIDAKAPTPIDLNKIDICWAAPLASRQKGEQKSLPFPRYHLEEEYDDENTAARDKAEVEFNRSLLLGFRRLEALERKRDFESMSQSAQVRLKGIETYPSIPMSSPLEPSIHLTTICSSSSATSRLASDTPSSSRQIDRDSSIIWEESGVGLCCAKMAPPNGRLVAVGCDDSAIRIFDLLSTSSSIEPSTVLLGHKNGFPVFDVDWNRDGRSLLSAGGDGAVRLWDTMAVGPFGEVVPVQSNATKATAQAGSNSSSSSTHRQTTTDDTDTGIDVPGWRPEDLTYSSGAALAVYRGHTPSSPVWSVAFAPCGYYFCSTGADATARLWTTDRPVPVRLFCGHTSSNVNCVDWHPNCNYIVTGGDDKTVRMWDIQTGRPVRLLDGCGAGINTVKVHPGGKYAAAADYSGVVHLWDLSTGKKVTQFSAGKQASRGQVEHNMVHRLSFSACGTSLAAGGDGCVVKIWDVRLDAVAEKPLIRSPTRQFPTKQTILMDLFYTKRNLLMSVGKCVTPISQVTNGLLY